MTVRAHLGTFAPPLFFALSALIIFSRLSPASNQPHLPLRTGVSIQVKSLGGLARARTFQGVRRSLTRVYDSIDDIPPRQGRASLDTLSAILAEPKAPPAVLEPGVKEKQNNKGLSALDSLEALLPQDPTPAPTAPPTKAKQDAFTGLVIPGKIVQEAVACKTVDDVANRIQGYVTQDDTKSALRLAAQCRTAKGGPLKNFASHHIVVPKKDYDLDELTRNNINTTAFVAPADDTLDDIRLGGSIAAFTGILALGYAFHWGIAQGVFCLAGVFGLSAYDVVNNNAGGSLLIVDSIGRQIFPGYRRRVAIHEAGHLLVSYLMGVLPVEYTLSAYDAYKKRGEGRGLKAAVQAGTRFADEVFKTEIASGSIRARSLDQFTCISLAGIASELVVLDKAEGGRSDLVQLDALLFALRFSPQRAAFQVRWSVFNTMTLLRKHKGTVEELANAMEGGASIADCIKLIEDRIPPPPPEEFDENGFVANKPLYEDYPPPPPVD